MCTSPRKIMKSGKYKCDNYHGLSGDFYEINTYAKCGVCQECRNEKSNSWVVRNVYEAKAHKYISFVTLTYAQNPVILVKKDFQDFIKRFRRYLDYRKLDKVRYFFAGEYGSRFGRPHAHLIIYGWKPEDVKYLTINNRRNLVYQSKTIEDLWGLGRTSIQDYNQEEIPYISLYCSPQEEFKRAYKINMQKCKTLKDKALKNTDMKSAARKNLIKELEEIEKKLKDEKTKYLQIKEYNTWSTALGWEKFFEEYSKEKIHTFEHYIGERTIATPSPWLKKLANMYGDIEAANELIRREQEMESKPTLEEEEIYHKFKVGERNKQELIKELNDITKNGVKDTF